METVRPGFLGYLLFEILVRRFLQFRSKKFSTAVENLLKNRKSKKFNKRFGFDRFPTNINDVESCITSCQIQHRFNGMKKCRFAARFQNEMRSKNEHARFAEHVSVRRRWFSILKNFAVDEFENSFDFISFRKEKQNKTKVRLGSNKTVAAKLTEEYFSNRWLPPVSLVQEPMSRTKFPVIFQRLRKNGPSFVFEFFPVCVRCCATKKSRAKTRNLFLRMRHALFFHISYICYRLSILSNDSFSLIFFFVLAFWRHWLL